MKYSTIFFDLDGTLTDPALGITNSIIYALGHYGIKAPDRTELYSFIGPPLADSFAKKFGFSAEKAIEAVEVYREYFREKGLFENEVYTGIPQMLKKLCDSGVCLALATSKPDVFSERIIKHFGLDKYISFIAANDLKETRPDKKSVILFGLNSFKIENPSQVIMVGDRKFDIEGGKYHGLTTVGVTYGYGGKDELVLAGADYIVDSVVELENLLLTLCYQTS